MARSVSGGSGSSTPPGSPSGMLMILRELLKQVLPYTATYKEMTAAVNRIQRRRRYTTKQVERCICDWRKNARLYGDDISYGIGSIVKPGRYMVLYFDNTGTFNANEQRNAQMGQLGMIQRV